MEIEEFAAKIIALGGSRWTKNSMDRIYIDPRKLSGFEPEWTDKDWAAARNQKYFYDLTANPAEGVYEPTELQVKAGQFQSRTSFGFAEEIEAFIIAEISK